MKAYYYVFYRLYAATSLMGWSKRPHINAVFEITTVDFLVAWTVAYLAVPLWATREFSGHFANALMLGAISFLPNYLLFLPNRRYENVVRIFKKESHRAQVVGNIAVVVSGFALLFLAAYVSSVSRH